ncbi:MAG: hypothetical protein JWR70_151 [Modestobacter sp.]|nr:hypothetical protein [Modestobacter sp.]
MSAWLWGTVIVLGWLLTGSVLVVVLGRAIRIAEERSRPDDVVVPPHRDTGGRARRIREDCRHALAGRRTPGSGP